MFHAVDALDTFVEILSYLPGFSDNKPRASVTENMDSETETWPQIAIIQKYGLLVGTSHSDRNVT